MPLIIMLMAMLAMPAFAEEGDEVLATSENNPLLQSALSPAPAPDLTTQLPIDTLWQQVQATLKPVAESYTALASGNNKADLASIMDGLAAQKPVAADFLAEKVTTRFDETEQAAIAQFLSTPAGEKFAGLYPQLWQETYDKALQDGFAIISAGGAKKPAPVEEMTEDTAVEEPEAAPTTAPTTLAPEEAEPAPATTE